MTVPTIKTYSGESFRTAYIQPELSPESLLKADFGRFFVVRVEDLSGLMKLPVPPTRITNHTLVYLTAGEAVMTIGHDTHKINRHECLVIPAGQVFSFDRVERNQGFLCNFHNDFIIGKFGGAELLNGFDFLRVWSNPRISLTAQTAGFVTNLCQRLLIEYADRGLTNPDIIQSYFIALLCELNTQYRPAMSGPPTSAVLLTNRFKELLFSRISISHLVTDYAALLHITPNHLNKIVRAVTGKSPTKWIDEAIVLEAKVLLYQSNLSINEITAAIGLADPSYFSRLFKKYEGVSPAAFRKMIEKSGKRPVAS